MHPAIVTVCYNSQNSIKRTIESVLNQTTPPYEHIFIDGKSTDNTVEIINSYSQEYSDRSIKLKVVSEEDEGYYDAMNKGIHLAEGDIIGILNSDDWYEKDAIKNLMRNAHNNPNYNIYMGGIYIHNGNQIITKMAGYSKHYQTSRKFNHPAMFATKETYNDVGGYINGNVHNDYGWYLKALKQGKKVCIMPEVFTNFQIGGVSSKKSFKNTIKRIKLKYQVYRNNGYSRLYWIECVGQELAKYLLVKG